MSDQCKEWVPGGTFRGHQCSRKAVRDGYCKQHHPDTIAERRAIASAERKKDRAGNEAKWARKIAVMAFCSGIPTDQLTPGGLRKLVGAARWLLEASEDADSGYAPGSKAAEEWDSFLTEAQDETTNILAPFKGGDDGEA